MSPNLQNEQNRQICRYRKYSSGCQGPGVEEWQVTVYGDGVDLWDDENVLNLDSGDGCMPL